MKAYSLDDETFRYDTIGDVMQALEDDDKLVVGAVYFEVDSAPVDLAEYLDLDEVLEQAECRAYDDLGECAEDAFNVTKIAAEELDAALKAWAAKHLPRGYWKCVGNSRQLTVTAEDVAKYSRPEESK